jgi:hypothetical protein
MNRDKDHPTLSWRLLLCGRPRRVEIVHAAVLPPVILACSSMGRHCDRWKRTAAMGVRRDKAALSSGCKPHPATAPAGSNRSRHGGDEMSEAFG